MVNFFTKYSLITNLVAQKMCYFIEYPEKINEMGLASFKIAQERFDAEKINRKLLKIIGLVSENEEIG